MPPKDAYSLDIKFDDALPYSGKILSAPGRNAFITSTTSNCMNNMTAMPGDNSAAYNLTSIVATCRVMYNID